jgi:hypothetical protein
VPKTREDTLAPGSQLLTLIWITPLAPDAVAQQRRKPRVSISNRPDRIQCSAAISASVMILALPTNEGRRRTTPQPHGIFVSRHLVFPLGGRPI